MLTDQAMTATDLTLALAELEADILKWLFGVSFARAGLVATLMKLI
jgi:hypothetical protein